MSMFLHSAPITNCCTGTSTSFHFKRIKQLCSYLFPISRSQSTLNTTPTLTSSLFPRFIHFPSNSHYYYSLNPPPVSQTRLISTTTSTLLSSSSSSSSSSISISSDTLVESVQQVEGNVYLPNNSAQVLKSFGFTHNHLSQIFKRRPSLQKLNPTDLQSTLNLFKELGFTPENIIKIIVCRPRFLTSCIHKDLDECLAYLASLFGSNDVLCKALIRNPSLLTCDLHAKIKPVVELYEEIGLSRKELSMMLISRPTTILRTSLNDEKLELIRKTGVTKESKMFKYVVTSIAISRLETLRRKIANLENFGIMEDDVLPLFGRSPLLLTLSAEKVQRNMTFIVGDMKFPAHVILSYPFLLSLNLEAVLRPRVCLAGKIADMDLVPNIKGPRMLTALKMTENRFIKAFIKSHPTKVAKELMKYYTNAKCVKRLAESSKKNVLKGFPF